MARNTYFKEMYPLENYKYYTFEKDNGVHIVATSTFAGQPVRGVAICDKNDNFDLEAGKKLAAYRCNLAVAKKRVKRAHQKYSEAMDLVTEAKNFLNKNKAYLEDAEYALDNAYEAVERITSDL